MENLSNHLLEKSKNVFSKYLPEDSVNNLCELLIKLDQESDSAIKYFSISPLDNIEDDIVLCFEKISSRIFSRYSTTNFLTHVDDEITLSHFILKIISLSDNHIKFINILKKVNQNWGQNMMSSNLLDSSKFDYYISQKNIFFNNLDKDGQDFFNLRYLYVYSISYTIYKSENEVEKLDIIVDKLLKLLNEIKLHENKQPTLKINHELIQYLERLKTTDENKDKFLIILKNMNLKYRFIENIPFIKDSIFKKDFDFFEKIFNLSPEMNNLRTELALLAIKNNQIEMFDFFLNQEYVSDLNTLIKTIPHDRHLLKKEITWIDESLGNNLNTLETILFKIYKSDDKELFFNKILHKKLIIENPLKIHSLLFEIKGGNFNIIDYLNFIKPLFTKNLLEEYINILNNSKKDLYFEINNHIKELLKLQLENINKTKKINSIKLKK